VTSTEVRLTGTTQEVLSPELSTVPKRIIGFSLDRILPFGGHWELRATGADLAGRPLAVSGAISTAADPGVQAQDGFEGTLAANSEGASLMTGYGTVPALSGAHSLWLESRRAVTLHLQRSGNESKLRFVARGFSESQAGATVALSVDAGIVGGTKRVTGKPTTTESAPASASGDATLGWVSDALTYQVTLSEPGTDVIVNLSSPGCEPYLACPATHWLIDDLKLE
jgi:hypothetical protein